MTGGKDMDLVPFVTPPFAPASVRIFPPMDPSDRFVQDMDYAAFACQSLLGLQADHTEGVLRRLRLEYELAPEWWGQDRIEHALLSVAYQVQHGNFSAQDDMARIGTVVAAFGQRLSGIFSQDLFVNRVRCQEGMSRAAQDLYAQFYREITEIRTGPATVG